MGRGGAKPQGVWGMGVPSGVQGRSPGRGQRDKVPQKLTHFHLYMLMFSVLAGIIPLSLRNGGGHFVPFATPLSASRGQLPPMLPGSAAYVNIILTLKTDH